MHLSQQYVKVISKESRSYLYCTHEFSTLLGFSVSNSIGLEGAIQSLPMVSSQVPFPFFIGIVYDRYLALESTL
jgi:hypothetical protein